MSEMFTFVYVLILVVANGNGESLGNLQQTTTDSTTLDNLQSGNKMLEVLERQIMLLRSEVAEIMQEKQLQIDAKEALQQTKTETETLRAELTKTREELQQIKDEHDRQKQILAKVRINEETTTWTKQTIKEIRNEIKQISENRQNITATELHRHNVNSQISLLRSDLSDALSGHQQLKVDHEKDAALIRQLQNDLISARKQNQKLANQLQASNLKTIQLEDDTALLQSNYRAVLNQIKKIEVEIADRHVTELLNNNEKNETPPSVHHRERHNHHSHLKRTVDALSETVAQAILEQSKIKQKIKSIEINMTQYNEGHTHQIGLLEDLTSEHGLNMTALTSKLANMENLMQTVERDNAKHSNGIQNLTEFTTSVYNLHDSTMQLFTSLEGIDTEISKNIDELQKEVSKIEYNVIQSQSAVDVIKQDQINHVKQFDDIAKQFSTSKIQMEKDHITLTSIHNDMLQVSVRKCKEENKDLTQDVQIAKMQAKVAHLENNIQSNGRDVNSLSNQLNSKVGQNMADMLKKAYRGVGSKLEVATAKLKQLDDSYEKLDTELSHFVYQLPNDCTMDIKNPAASYKSGVYLIRPIGMVEANEVYCDMGQSTSNRWTVIQQRMNGAEDFNRDWQQYKQGFGNRHSEYWIGNEVLHHLTDQANYTLRIELWDKSLNYSYADYDSFYVGDESDKYRLYIDGYKGNASDSLSYHNKQAFSTKDSDNDASSTHCAVYYSAGWWYTHCQYVNANGLYDTGLTWYNVKEHTWTQLSKIVLKIRKK